MRTNRFAKSALLALALTVCIAGAATAGPPWISIETPVNPFDATTRGAYLLVHSFHHGTEVGYPISGTAEGIVNGERKRVVLQFTQTSRQGVYALKKNWDDRGTWTLVIAVEQGKDDVAQAIVDIGSNGEVARVNVPTKVGERGLSFPRQLSGREIEEALRARVAVAAR